MTGLEIPGAYERASVLVTCEHGGHRIPRRYARLFAGAAPVLASHRGFDLGAADVATVLAGILRAPLLVATTSRLLVDLNRSLHHPRLFSEWTRPLGREERRRIVDEYYAPHRAAVDRAIASARGRGRHGRLALHLAVHSFTPVLNGVERRADVGLLYDPKRRAERAFTDAFREALARAAPELVVRLNFPYRGTADGLTTALRQRHEDRAYAGIELEINQRWLRTRRDARRFAERLAGAFG